MLVTARPAATSGPTTGEGSTVVWMLASALTLTAAGLATWGLIRLESGRILWATVAASEEVSIGPVILVAVLVIFACERIWPAAPRPVRSAAHLVDAGYLLLVVAVAPVIALANAGLVLALRTLAPWLTLPRMAVLPQAAVAVVIVVGMDAANWVAHAANHRSRVLWRFHALHHSQEDMSVLTTFRTHPMTHASYLMAVLPALVLEASGTVPATVLAAYGVAVALPHANLRWSFGRLGRWVVSPAYHRLHHRRRPGPAVNYGFVLTVWDRLAGTALFPAGAPEPTGLSGRPVPVEQAEREASGGLWKLFGRQLAQPFRPHSGLETP